MGWLNITILIIFLKAPPSHRSVMTVFPTKLRVEGVGDIQARGSRSELIFPRRHVD